MQQEYFWTILPNVYNMQGQRGGSAPPVTCGLVFSGLGGGGGVGSVSSWLRLPYIVYVLHWSTRFLELQDDKLSVRKATLLIPCKKQGFLTLGALRPGLTPPFTQHAAACMHGLFFSKQVFAGKVLGCLGCFFCGTTTAPIWTAAQFVWPQRD